MARATDDDINVVNNVDDIDVDNHDARDDLHDVDHINFDHDLDDVDINVEFASTDQRGAGCATVSLTLRCHRR
jgi:hypothetical protein